MAIKGATSRCQRACHQCLLNTLASYLFRSPPNVVHHRGCPLASLHRGCCNPGCPRAPKPYVHPSGQWKAQGSHSRSGGFTAMVCGKLLNTQPGTLYNRVMWDIYEWYLLCHCGAVLRGHLDYESMSYDLGLCGTTMCGICYFMAEQYCE